VITHPAAPDVRPHRSASAPGQEITIHTDGRVLVWRQIGWHGGSGAFYALGEDPSRFERGSFRPLWILADNELDESDVFG